MSALLRLALLALALLSPLLHARPYVAIFASPDCDECKEIKQWWRRNRAEHTGVTLVTVDMGRTVNFTLLSDLEKELGAPAGSALPVVYAGGKLFHGADETIAAMKEIVALARAEQVAPKSLSGLAAAADAGETSVVEYTVPAPALNVAVPSPVPALDPRATATLQPGELRMAYFVLPGCQKCSRQNLVLQGLEKELPNLKITRFDITTPSGLAALDLVRRKFNLTGDAKSHVPLLVWDDSFSGEKNLGPEPILARLKPQSGTPFWLEQDQNSLATIGTELARQDVAGMDIGVIAVAGLLDGINPCAFAVSIFLIGYLVYLGRDKRDILLLGGSFCAGVFISYFLLGIGLSYFMKWLNAFPLAKIMMYAIFGLIGMVLGALHIRDAIRYHRSGRSKDMDMGLSLGTTQKIHAYIRRFSGSRWLVPAGLLLGFVISALELACTGQIYLPAIAIANKAGWNGRALGLLLLYNTLFVLPLVAVTGMAVAGVTTKALAAWAKKNLVRTKLAMAVLFFVLGLVMLGMALRDVQQLSGPAVQAIPRGAVDQAE